MKNLIVDRKVNIQASFVAADWNLPENEESEEIAHRLNEELEFLVNSGFSEPEIQKKMSNSIKKLSKYVEKSQETTNFLEKVLKSIFIY